MMYLSKAFMLNRPQQNRTRKRGRVSFQINFILTTMNTLAERFSTTNATSYIRNAQILAADDEEFSDAAWGSEAGFGSLAKGVPNFSVPAVPDVRHNYISIFPCLIIFSPPLSCDCTPTTTQIPIAESRSSTGQRH